MWRWDNADNALIVRKIYKTFTIYRKKNKNMKKVKKHVDIYEIA